MSVLSASASRQMTLDFTPGLTERHDSLLSCIRECAHTQRSPMKAIAADMDLSLSELSRKLAGNPDDTRRFSVDDLERFVAATGDVTPIYYLIERYLEDENLRHRRAIAELVKLAPQLAALIKQAGVGV
jgi:hypothetical protein